MEKQETLIGKTIKHINFTAVNYMVIFFTDGSSLELETEHVGHGIYGINGKVN